MLCHFWGKQQSDSVIYTHISIHIISLYTHIFFEESDTTERLIWSDVTPKIWSCITGLNTFMIRNLPASSLLLFIFWCSLGTHSLLNVFTKMTRLHLAMVSHDECCNLNLTPVWDAFQGGFEICKGHVVSYKIDTKFFVLRTHRKFIFQHQ